VIHQATGYVLAQVGVGPDDAALLIQAQAFTTGQTMMEVSENILGGRLTFARVGDRIEVRS
jgi:AmiR/NasT family two-component response regulator